MAQGLRIDDGSNTGILILLTDRLDNCSDAGADRTENWSTPLYNQLACLDIAQLVGIPPVEWGSG